jgi:uncharacterized protein (DUF362 family)
VFARFTALTFCLCASAHAAAEAVEPEAPRATPANATVWVATEKTAVDGFVENPSVTRRMVDQLVQAAAGETDIARAWRKFVTPQDRIGIKVNASSGRSFCTRVGVVRAVLDGLEQAGVKTEKVIVWDTDSADLRAAGFDSKRLGCQVRGIDPPHGWDRTAPFIAPSLGKLIWGDLLFVEKNSKAFGKSTSEADQLSSNSHFATIVTKDVTKIINIPTLTDDAGCGIAGAFYNVCVRNVDNWRRFVSSEHPALESIPAIYAEPQIGPKVVLHLLDGLVAQYAGGPEGNPNYALSHATIYAAVDPVALDSVAARKLETWRKNAKLPSIARQTEWLEAADAAGIGISSESRIKVVPVLPP